VQLTCECLPVRKILTSIRERYVVSRGVSHKGPRILSGHANQIGKVSRAYMCVLRVKCKTKLKTCIPLSVECTVRVRGQASVAWKRVGELSGGTFRPSPQPVSPVLDTFLRLYSTEDHAKELSRKCE